MQPSVQALDFYYSNRDSLQGSSQRKTQPLSVKDTVSFRSLAYYTAGGGGDSCNLIVTGASTIHAKSYKVILI